MQSVIIWSPGYRKTKVHDHSNSNQQNEQTITGTYIFYCWSSFNCPQKSQNPKELTLLWLHDDSHKQKPFSNFSKFLSHRRACKTNLWYFLDSNAIPYLTCTNTMQMKITLKTCSYLVSANGVPTGVAWKQTQHFNFIYLFRLFF